MHMHHRTKDGKVILKEKLNSFEYHKIYIYNWNVCFKLPQKERPHQLDTHTHKRLLDVSCGNMSMDVAPYSICLS